MKIIRMAIILVVLLVVVEISLRIVIHRNNNVIFSQVTTDDPILDWRLTPNFSQPNRGMHINSMGFRGDDFRLVKSTSYRIIALGDSCTFGTGNSDDMHTYPKVLEKKLNSLADSDNFEVINAGVPGYTSRQCLLYFKNKLLTLDADLIIIYCGWNDIWTYRNPYDNTASSAAVRDISRAMSKSMVFTLFRDYALIPLKKSILKLKKKEVAREAKLDVIAKELKLDLYAKNIAEIIDLADAHKIKVMLITLPLAIREGQPDEVKKVFPLHIIWQEGYDGFFDMYKSMNQELRVMGEDKNVVFVDVDMIFRRFSDKKANSLFYDLVHLNDEGSEILADVLYKPVLKEFNLQN